MRIRTAVIATFVLAVAMEIWAVPSACAQEKDKIATMQARILQLEERVRELEALLGEDRSAIKTSEGHHSGWQNKKNWRRLSVGLEDGDVRHILGNPSKVIHGVKTLWYYPNIYRGYVTFDETGRLIGWNEP